MKLAMEESVLHGETMPVGTFSSNSIPLVNHFDVERRDSGALGVHRQPRVGALREP
jgi:hypothetical protein